MSGREHEPVAAFFPSIDRNLMRDLDRHLRTAEPPAPVAVEADASEQDDLASSSPQPEPQRPLASTSDILEAVDQAATAMAAMQARIEDLEAKEYELETTNTQLRAKLGELLQGQQAAESMSRADRQRAVAAEQSAAQHHARAQVLENDLAAALSDLQKIAEAITGALANVADH